jgi:hypothetical protein
MTTIITQPGRAAHPEPHPDVAARRRRDRLARATAEDMESALAFLSMIDPEAFEIALTATAPRAGATPEEDASEDEEPLPRPAKCHVRETTTPHCVSVIMTIPKPRTRTRQDGLARRPRRPGLFLCRRG